MALRKWDGLDRPNPRGRGYVIMRDKEGNPYKVMLPKGDPGGEHE